MKPRGSKVEYEKERNNELMEAYHKLIDSADCICMDKIYRICLHLASSFRRKGLRLLSLQ